MKRVYQTRDGDPMGPSAPDGTEFTAFGAEILLPTSSSIPLVYSYELLKE